MVSDCNWNMRESQDQLSEVQSSLFLFFILESPWSMYVYVLKVYSIVCVPVHPVPLKYDQKDFKVFHSASLVSSTASKCLCLHIVSGIGPFSLV